MISPRAAVAILASVVASAPDAGAGEIDTASTYMVATMEVTAGAMAAAGLYQNKGPSLAFNFVPIALGIGGGVGAWALDLTPRPALGVHGALWGGTGGFLAGALIDGRRRPFGLRAGAAAYVLGAAGAVAGATLGAISVDDSTEAGWWLMAPPAGFAAGGLVLGIAFMAIGGFDGDRAPGQMAAGALIGLTAGLGLATYMAVRDDGDPDAMPVARGVRRVSLFSFGAAF